MRQKFQRAGILSHFLTEYQINLFLRILQAHAV